MCFCGTEPAIIAENERDQLEDLSRYSTYGWRYGHVSGRLQYSLDLSVIHHFERWINCGAGMNRMSEISSFHNNEPTRSKFVEVNTLSKTKFGSLCSSLLFRIRPYSFRYFFINTVAN